MEKRYFYSGSKELLKLVSLENTGSPIHSRNDLIEWVRTNNRNRKKEERITVTFVVNEKGDLMVADRHSEHVVCAGGKPVLSAGELAFAMEGKDLELLEATNQSTGYCPEPESWQHVRRSLDPIFSSLPDTFTIEFIFRRCPVCNMITIVKNDWFYCYLCKSELPKIYNIQSK